MADFLGFNPETGEEKKKHFRLPDDFSEFAFTQLVFSHGRAMPRSVFPRFFEFSQTVLHCTAIRKMFLYTRAKQEISTFPLSEQQGPG